MSNSQQWRLQMREVFFRTGRLSAREIYGTGPARSRRRGVRQLLRELRSLGGQPSPISDHYVTASEYARVTDPCNSFFSP